ncbi:carbohydrate-binding protein [Stanieria cyanosphaera]|nr:carbohydrate-binding protein [Stanieria cyanosphaera]
MNKSTQLNQSIRIEAEDYLSGNQGITYYDSSIGNYGQAYRQDWVDLEKTTDAGGGYNVGWIDSGEWLTYDLQVPVDGTYEIVARVASPKDDNHNFGISVNGKELDRLNFNSTGGWQSWQNVRGKKINLTAGNHKLRLDMYSSLFNINYLELIPVTSPATEGNKDIRIEAEDYQTFSDLTSGNIGQAYRQDDVDLEKTSDAGGGYNVGWIDSGEWLTYDLEVPESGVYKLVTRIASDYNIDHGIKFSLDGKSIDQINFQDTNGWQSWQDVAGKEIYLTEGSHQLRLDAVSSGFNINYIDFEYVSPHQANNPPKPIDNLPQPVENPPTPIENPPLPVENPPSLEGATYYLAPYGNDSNDGSLENPFFSLEKVSSIAKPGDVIYLRGGEYKYTTPQWLSAQGTEEARITFMSAPGETAILDGSYISDHISVKDIVGITGKYLDFKNLEVTNSKRHGISGWGASHVRLINNYLHHNQHSGAWFGYQDLTTSTGIVFDGNLVEYNDLVSQYDAPAGHPGALVTMGASNSTFVNNIVRKNYGEGIISVLTKGSYIANNQISDNVSVNLYLDNTSDVIAEKNLIYNTGDTRFHVVGRAASGIQVANEKYDFYFNLSNQEGGFKIVNNIIADNAYGFFYGSYDQGGGLRDSLIANNTFYHADNTLLFISKDTGHQNTTFANNIFIQEPDDKLLSFEGSSGINWSNNGWVGGNPGAATGANDVITNNPVLIAPNLDNISGFGLQNNSPFLGKGLSNFGIAEDYFGTARDGSIDLGAIQNS